MVPDWFIGLEAMPYTPNNKIDRNEIRKLISERNDQPVSLAHADKGIVAIWCKYLKLKKWDDQYLHSSFFRLGGHSMDVLEVIDEVQKTYGAELAFKDFYASPILKDLQELIMQRSELTVY